MISHEHKCAFVHIPKTAGRSVGLAFGKRDQFHKSIDVLKKEIGDEKYYFFSVVRNPLDRMVSMYFYLKNKNEFPYEQNMTFDDFIKEGKEWWDSKPLDLSTKNKEIKNFYFSPQTMWIARGGKIEVDKVIKFEKLNEQFQFIIERFNLKNNLPHTNASSHNHYSTYYNKNSKSLVKEWFESDFNMFYNLL